MPEKMSPEDVDSLLRWMERREPAYAEALREHIAALTGPDDETMREARGLIARAADQIRQEQAAQPPEPTTAEAFAMVSEALGRASDRFPGLENPYAAALTQAAMLERRMGAQEAALRGCRTHLKCADGCACDVCAALAGASAAPSLEEAEERAREVYEAAISRREHQPVALSLAVRAVVRLAPSGTVSASGPCDCGHSSCTAPALTDAPPVFTLEEVEVAMFAHGVPYELRDGVLEYLRRG